MQGVGQLFVSKYQHCQFWENVAVRGMSVLYYIHKVYIIYNYPLLISLRNVQLQLDMQLEIKRTIDAEKSSFPCLESRYVLNCSFYDYP